MAIPVNPYVAGNPVGDSPAFVGRADVLREVLRVLRRSQDNAIVLYGQRRIGKTSILQHLAAWLPREGPYRPVYFDLQDKADWPLDRVLQELARSIAHTLGQPDPDLGPDPETAFRQEWLPAVLGDLPDGSSLVLLFDEFDVLADPKAEQAAAAFFPYLRDLLALDPQRLQFAFVIGRNVDDLANIALSLFKGTPYQRVSLLDQEDTTDLVRLSQANDTLRWPDEAVEQVWQLTDGHPFLTQQLCSHVWERAYDEEPKEPPSVTPADVDAAVPEALEASRNTLEWLWDGLPPAGRIVASALAKAGPGPITQEELQRLLHESGVRVVIRELQNAPHLLQEWDLIEPADGGYRFRVELLRRWMAEHKPLRRVQEELDRIEPVAENYYRAALGLYRGGQLDQAIDDLKRAIGLNPNHVGANQLLADILLAQGQPGEARELLERLYEYQPAAARSRLVQALLAQAHTVESADEQLTLYKRVLELDPTQPEATAKVTEIEQEARRRDLAARLSLLEALEHMRRYSDALDIAHRLADEYPEVRDWTSELEQLERKTHLAELYQHALGALQSGDRQTAQTLLTQVVALEPGYEEATRYLHLAVTGVDVTELQAQLKAEKARQEKVPYAEQRRVDDRTFVQAEYRYDAFISYSHADHEWVQSELLPRLEEAGLKVIIDYRDFEIGIPSLINMERAVDNSRHTLIVLTPAWIESQWTEFESLLAGTVDPAGRRRKLIPLMLKPCKLPARIAMLTYADLTKPQEREWQLRRVIDAIKRTEEPSTTIPRLTWRLLALLVFDVCLATLWGWYLFGKQINLLGYLQVVFIVLVPLILLTIVLAVRKPVAWIYILHRLETSQNIILMLSLIAVITFLILGIVSELRQFSGSP